MVSLARSTLLYEWRRFLTAVLALAFSALLVIVQLGLLLGMFGTVSVVVDNARADLWVTSPNTPSFDMARTIPLRNEAFLRMHPEVVALQPLIFGVGDWKASDGSKTMAVLIGIDISPKSLSMPVVFSANQRIALEEPGSVIVDKADIRKLHTDVGQTAELNGKRVKVVSTVSGFRNIGGVYMFTSHESACRLLGSLYDQDKTNFFLLKLRDPKRAEIVKKQLVPSGTYPQYTVWTAKELSYKSQKYWLLESGAGAGFGFSSLLGLLVGIAITSQTLRSAILASIREYAALRALGVSLRALRAVVLEQSLWVGFVGLVVAAILTLVVAIIAKIYYVMITFPWWALSFTAIFTLVIALLSGVLALKVLYKTEPAELLR